MFNVIKYLKYVFIEINNKCKYIYNCIRRRMGLRSFGVVVKKTALMSGIWGIVMSYLMNLAHGTIIIGIADKHTDKDFYMVYSN